jgi:aspartate/methionine/tyrosine aminotransferase
LRIGWLATKDVALLGKLQVLKDYTTICSSAPSEILAIMALRARDGVVERNMEIIHRNLEAVGRSLAQHGDWFGWLKPEAGSVAFPRLTVGVPVDDFCQDVLQQKGVMIVPGSMFEYPGQHFRLGLGRENLPQALAQVGEYVRRVKGEAPSVLHDR